MSKDPYFKPGQGREGVGQVTEAVISSCCFLALLAIIVLSVVL